MIELDVGDHAGERSHDVGGIQPTAQAGFPDDQIAFLLEEMEQSDDGDDFEEGWMTGRARTAWTARKSFRSRDGAMRSLLKRSPTLIKQSAHLPDQPDRLALAQLLAVHLDAFTKSYEVRR